MLIFIALGIVASIFQLTIFREFTYSLAKNELSLILGVGVWLISCSLGSLLLKKKKILNPAIISSLFALFYSLVISAIHLIKSSVGLSYYETASLGFVFIAAIFLISPVGLLIGYSFRAFSQAYLDKHSPKVRTFGKFFAYEAIGFFIGGVAFSFLFSSYSNPFIFTILALLLLITFDAELKEKIISALVIILLTIVSFFSFTLILKLELKGADIIKLRGSSYGPIILAQKFGVESLYANGSLIATSEDKAGNEQFIHSVLAANPKAKDILFIGPYFFGQIQEILKYPIKSLDCVDINPVLPALSSAKLEAIPSKGVNFIVTDPRLHLKKTMKKYDCIIMNISVPSSLASNRYFSYQFFQLIRERLNDKGIFSFRIPSKADILSRRFVRFNSCIINTLGRVFKNRLLIPGDSMIIIASMDKSISLDDLLINFESSKFPTDYFTKHHFKDSLGSGRIPYLEEALDKGVDINSDFNLLGFLYYSFIEQAKFYPRISINISMVRGLAVIVFIITVFFASGIGSSNRKPGLLLNAAVVGFSSIGLTAVIFVLFQLYSGALFWKMGILTGIFMAGLSTGIFLVNSLIDRIFKIRKPLPFLYFLWFFLLVGLWAGIKSFNGNYRVEFVFYIGSFLSGVLTGSLYPMLSRLIFTPLEDSLTGLTDKTNLKDLAASIYRADLTGAAIGTISFSILFIPFLGVGLSLLLIMFLVFTWGLKEHFN